MSGASGLFGVVSALAQHDLKRLLAYHSVENIGIAALGLGLGLLGWSAENWTLAALGFAGALLQAHLARRYNGNLRHREEPVEQDEDEDDQNFNECI